MMNEIATVLNHFNHYIGKCLVHGYHFWAALWHLSPHLRVTDSLLQTHTYMRVAKTEESQLTDGGRLGEDS